MLKKLKFAGWLSSLVVGQPDLGRRADRRGIADRGIGQCQTDGQFLDIVAAHRAIAWRRIRRRIADVAGPRAAGGNARPPYPAGVCESNAVPPDPAPVTHRRQEIPLASA